MLRSDEEAHRKLSLELAELEERMARLRQTMPQITDQYQQGLLRIQHAAMSLYGIVLDERERRMRDV